VTVAATTDTKALQKYTAEERERNARILRERISPAFEASETVGLMIKPRGRESVADDTDALLTVLAECCAKGETGEETLLIQARTLDMLFNRLTRVALSATTVAAMAEPLRLAMRAQAQSRATLQAASDIRHPRRYIGQQNVAEQYNAGGHQQVNRDAHGSVHEKPPTELSEGTSDDVRTNGSTPAGGTGTGTAGETVDVLHRAANG